MIASSGQPEGKNLRHRVPRFVHTETLGAFMDSQLLWSPCCSEKPHTSVGDQVHRRGPPECAVAVTRHADLDGAPVETARRR